MEPDAKLQALIAKAPRWEHLPPPVPAAQLPQHIAIIMDGNGRWATRRGLIRVTGHQAGAESVRSATRYCGQIGVKVLTVYAFSTENWKRPRAEVTFLFRLLKKYLVGERAELIANGVRLTTIGDNNLLPAAVHDELKQTMALTARGQRLTLCLALNYGSQDELLSAARRLATQVAAGQLLPNQIDEEAVRRTLFTAEMPPVELLIRTAGERRVSNFLLWQICGAQFYVAPVCWPEFREPHLRQAIVESVRPRVAAG